MQQRAAALMLCALIVLLGAVHPAGAQYFGRNKVQYKHLDFRILETPHFSIYYYPAEERAVFQAGRLAERWYARLSRMLSHEFRHRHVIILYASHAQFAQTNVVSGFVSDGVGGLTDGLKGRVVLPFAAGLAESDHVLGHELVHAFQRDILRRQGRSIDLLPLWFIEGMAEYLSIGGIDPNTAMWLRDATAQNRLPQIDQLDDPRWFPYRYGQALWAFLAERYGEDVAARCLTSNARGGALARIAAVTGSDPDMLSAAWQDWIRRSWPADRPDGESDGSRPLLTARGGGGRLNVGPALSPDGRQIVFLSERDRYSIDVFLADAITGEIVRRIVRTAGDPHFDSLQFIESAGAWNPTGRSFVLAALSGGAPVLTIIDVRTGDIAREIRLDQLDQIFSPTWSPDGRQLAFSAQRGGVTDLYVLSLETGALRRLTDDQFADLQPAWSPDGSTIVFSSDRFSSTLSTLSFGHYRLGVLDIASGRIRELASIPDAKHIDPHWSPNGQSIYFIADAGGVNNVYRIEMATGDLFRITDVSTGVSGITALSPALSVASRADRLAFSVYRDGAYEVRTLDRTPGVALPSIPVKDPERATARHRPESPPASPAALLSQDEFTVRPYQRHLSLRGIGQPYLSAGGGSLGGFLRAGTSMSFGDTLDNQQLHTAIQAGKSVDDFAAQAVYLDLRSRWSWGVAGASIHWLAGASKTEMPAVGRTTIARESVVLRQLHRQLSGLAMYPFSSAQRLEIGGGVHAIAFKRRTVTDLYAPETGRLVSRASADGTAAPPVRLFETTIALVRDTAVFGATSPVLGERYRVALQPAFGDLRFATVTADYRKYVMPVRPFTIAMRIEHVGRYGTNAGDPRLPPIMSTLRNIVRGYGDTFAPNRGCANTTEADCAVLSYLSTRGLAAANLELRFPLFGVVHRNVQYGPVPLEGFVFSDAGSFWSQPLTGAATRTMLRSAGAGVRINAAGVIFELNVVRPVDRASRGWTFAFNVRPGF